MVFKFFFLSNRSFFQSHAVFQSIKEKKAEMLWLEERFYSKCLFSTFSLHETDLGNPTLRVSQPLLPAYCQMVCSFCCLTSSHPQLTGAIIISEFIR